MFEVSMKKSLLILSAASLAASSAMAQTYSAANDKCVKQATGSTLTTTDAKAAMPLHCRPEVTFYITGATAQAGYMTGTAVPNLLLESGFFTIREGNGSSAAAPTTRLGDSSAVGWYGYGKAGTNSAGKRVYIGYNPKGSIEGVMQVMSTTAKEPEATWTYPGDDGKCFVSSGTTTYFCGAYKAMETGLALSDVKPEEGDLVWMKAQNGGKVLPKYDSTALRSVPVGLQAFGLIVNNNFYKALRDRDIARGYLPASCDSEAYSGVTTVTSACRPTMSRHEYASLIAEGGATNLTFLLGASGSSSKLVVNRRYGGSGTQASSNVYFLDNPCGGRGFASTTTKALDGLGLNIDKTDKVVSNTYGGGLIPRSGAAATSNVPVTGTAYNNISVVEWTSGSDLAGANGVGSTTDFQIGVRNVAADDNALWKWIKLDGVDPIGGDNGFKSDATTASGGAAAPFNYNLRTGRYPFAVVFYTVMTQASFKKTTDPVSKMAVELTNALATPTVNLNGIASLPANASGSKAEMRGTLSRPNNNNCAPLKMTGA
jgi:hypothetical protein